MRITIIILSFFFLYSCSKKEHVIEIYTLKSRAKNLHGISAQKYFLNKNDTTHYTIINDNTTIDTLKNELIYAGEFLIDINNLEDKPLINDNDILFLDTKTNQIVFTESAKKLLSSFKGHTREGIQFVMTDNRKPIISGYFWNDFSSSWSNWNCISYCILYKEKNHINKMYKGIGNKNLEGKSIDFSNYEAVIKAFTESNRIKN